MMRSDTLLLLLCCCVWPAASLPAADGDAIQFNRDIRRLLFDRCVACHGPDARERQADLRLDIEEEAKTSAIVPGNPTESEFIRRITSDDPAERMPPETSGKTLNAEEIDLLTRWVAAGAAWQPHWAFLTPVRPPIPEIDDPRGVKNGIDDFVRAPLAQQGIAPSPQAAPEQLIRRVSFDLTGLPPTIEEIDAFVLDHSPEAYESLVDRLLASPRYGEHLAAGWMQAARFADSNGFQNDFRREQWPWRDWVINAFNNNMPFDQFVLEQLAGDLLPNPTRDQLVATGFNRNNRTVTEAGSIDEEWRVENNVDRVETTCTVFLGLTMGCSRCHDHKYDPLTQKDFYRFFGFFDALDEKGVYTETRGNVPPLVALPTPENEERLQEFNRQIAAADATLNALAQAAMDRLFFIGDIPLKSAPEPTIAFPFLETLTPGAGSETATYPAGEPTFVEGLLGPSLVLDGTENSHVTLTGIASPDRSTPFAYSLWVRPDGRNSAILGQMEDGGQSRGWDTLLLKDGRLKVHLIHQYPQNSLEATTKTTLPNGEWSHITVSYDGSSKAAGVAISINGKPAEIEVGNDQLTDSFAVDLPLRLGRRSEMFFKGAMSHFAWFDRALTSDEILAWIQHDLGRAAQNNVPEWSEARQNMFKKFLIAVDEGELQAAQAQLDTLRKERADYDAAIPTVMIMKDRAEPRPTYRLDRGAYDDPDTSEQLTPAVPTVFAPMPAEYGPNRLALAHWIIDRQNPLTARVQVNRIWQRMFGVGIVKSSENFGVQADPPSHPELLDWLAVEFMESGWNLKQLQKLIVMSATYQQSSDATPAAVQADPENRLLARGPRLRLSAETVRDNALAISGLLTEKLGGPSVKPYQPAGLWEELQGGANEGPYVLSEGENLYRRSLYTNRKRTVPHTTMSTFDAPTYEYCTVKRSTTNTPLQALALLNDVTYLEAARKLAERMIVEGGADAASRVTLGFRLATGRRPAEEELDILTRGLNAYLQQFDGDESAATAVLAQGASDPNAALPRAKLAAYTTLAGILLNLDEAIIKP
ncbi:MAG: DUF1553 domain-containing protein [Planctomycetaceae bacterium]|nr:DUF1553 domain-containing protein [Planctomycetaceae bacterium]